MGESEKESENNLEAARGKVGLNDRCEDFSPKPYAVGWEDCFKRCANCIHFRLDSGGDITGSCGLGH